MILSQSRPSPDTGMRPAPGAGEVRISPSRQQLRRADPSLSFQVSAPGARFFDVIVATDPTLFSAAEAHRRTPKNFRSSRQDFQGEPIEIETGFYMLPRAFLRDAISVEPRPTRLYYLAVAYDDAEAREGRFSVPPGQAAASAPHVSLAGDLNAAGLSKVLGVAVERLGAVNAAGRVMSAASTLQAAHLPEEIGGLPLLPRHGGPPQGIPVGTYPEAPPPEPTPANGGPEPIPAPITNGGPPANGIPGQIGAPLPNGTPRAPVAPPPVAGQEPVAPARAPDMAPTGPGNGAPAGFVDEDYLHAAPAAEAGAAGFRDLDAAPPSTGVPYDDGYGPMDASAAADTPEPIPPLDPAPEPAPPQAAAPQPAAPRPPQPQPAAPHNGAPAASPPPAGAAPAPETQALDALVQAVIAEGAGGRYDALNLDGAFRGRMGQTHPYYQRAHEGLRYGPAQVSQDSGELGELLSLMRAADPAGFDQFFGSAAAQLVETTTRTGPNSGQVPGGRSARVQPVEGKDLWEEPWVDRFRAAAGHAPFQAAMRAQIISRRLEPVLPVAEALGLDSRRGRAMLLAMALHMGVERAVAAIRAAINPLDTPARVAAALEALGHTEIGSFRKANGLPDGDQIDAPTHFALIAALRGLGADSPVQIPDDEAAMDLLVTGVGPGTVGDALLKLRVSETIQPDGAAG